MSEPLTPEQASWACSKVAEWLRIKLNAERITRYRNGEQLSGNWLDVYGSDIMQLDPDAWHSALLARLLQGKEPLPEPPVTNYAYPDYTTGEVAKFERLDGDGTWALTCRTCGEREVSDVLVQEAKAAICESFVRRHSHVDDQESDA
jgi:hypothetical protein